MAAPNLLSASPAGNDKPYGSGRFGEWITDEFGLPAFRYTCDQTTDPEAVTNVGPGLLSKTEHIHQVGNDRLVALASNYGHVQVRQDEGAPKLLNLHYPEKSQFGGGIGYLAGAGELLTTYYPCAGHTFERIFGVGYFRKTVAGKTCSADQVIFAPFGDDPVLLSQVTVSNRSSETARLRWIEYWGCHQYQFSFRSFIESFVGGRLIDVRYRLGERFAHGFERLPGNRGLLETKRFLGRTPQQEAMWKAIKANLATDTNPFIAPVKEDVPEASFDDLHPPATFLVSLDAPADHASAAGRKFFGEGGAANPAGAAAPLDDTLDATGPESGLLLERDFVLNPGEKRTLYFLYGYLPQGATVDSLVSRYAKTYASAWKDSSAQWRGRGLTLSTPSEPWVERECAWNYYYLRSSLTYDDFFQQHILSQGGIYQYSMGFQGAARDPLQHALPFLFSDPQIVREVLRYTLKEVRADGSIPYGIVGHGMVMPTQSDNSSDLPMWLLWAMSEYVLATRDTAFLDEELPTYPPNSGKDSVRHLLARCYRHLVEDVRTGEHGLMRMLVDDWNDALVMAWGQKARKECIDQGESVLNSAMAAWVFDYYARLLAFTNDTQSAAAARRSAEQHRRAARAQWTGKWVRRAWLGPTLGWLGEKGFWLEPQPWAILGGVTTPEQSRELVRALDSELRRPSPIGAMQMNRSADMLTDASLGGPGTSISGGVWPSLNATLIWALAGVDGGLAWDEWKKNSFARHAEVYPNIWYHTWSGPDTLNSVLSAKPGATVDAQVLRFTDFPVMNLHTHACPLYSATKLVGTEFTEEGVRLAPRLPLDSYRLESPLLGVVKTSAGYEGWYAPSKPGTWTISLHLAAPESTSLTKATVNGASVRLARAADGSIQMKGPSAPGKPLRWSLSRA